MYYYKEGKKVKYNHQSTPQKKSMENFRQHSMKKGKSCHCSRWITTVGIIILIVLVLWFLYLLYKNKTKESSE